MRTITTVAEMTRVSLAAIGEGRGVGLVPTMGALHEGHQALIARCRLTSDVVVVSIFVNPTQFLKGEDYEEYPRDLKHDEDQCRALGVDVVFAPGVKELYEGDASTRVVETSLSSGLCGESRPGHFEGVTTVVAKLLNIIQPAVAVFGEKDLQQLQVIRRMVRDLRYPVSIEGVATIREADGLAMSSRNSGLVGSERERAGSIYASLQEAARLFRDGVRDAAAYRDRVEAILMEAGKPESIDYIAVVDGENLVPVAQVDEDSIVMVAVKIGATRLIDNIRLGSRVV